MYKRSARTELYYDRTGSTSRRGPGKKTEKKDSGRQKERTLFTQLLVCLILFLTVFVGKGIFPGQLTELKDQVRRMISEDFDFKNALSQLGESMAGSDSVLGDLGEFCIQVFGSGSQTDVQPASFQPPQPAAVLTSELLFLSENPDVLTRTEHYSAIEKLGLKLNGWQKKEPEEEPKSETEPESVTSIMPAGQVYKHTDYSGPDLPNNYTMDVLSLGGLETTTPLLGHLNSGYGYRTHPVNGKAGDFHGGIDIGGQTGDPITAFASGTVEYTGQDDSYGIYLQIDHGNGVKSFYAHCSKVLVKKGQQVSIGDTVALVGSTGTATGPHLHLELKYNKMHMNPAYYVEFLNDQ